VLVQVLTCRAYRLSAEISASAEISEHGAVGIANLDATPVHQEQHRSGYASRRHVGSLTALQQWPKVANVANAVELENSLNQAGALHRPED